MTARPLIAASLLLGLAFAPASAHAQSGEAMPELARLLLPACEGQAVAPAELIDALGLELQGHGIRLNEPAADHDGTPAVAILALDAPECQQSSLVIRVIAPATGRATEEQVTLDDIPQSDRARILALTIAELLERSWAELVAPPPRPEPPPPPSVEPTPPEATAPEPRVEDDPGGDETEPQPSPPPRLLLGLTGGVEAYPLFAGALFGPAVQANLRLSRTVPLRLALELGYRFGGATDELGTIDTHRTGGAVSLLVAGHWERLLGEVGARLDLAWVRAVGEAADQSTGAATLDGALVTLAATADLGLRLTRMLWLLASIQVGYVVHGLEVLADSHRLGGVGGPVIGAQVGLALSL